MSGRFVDGTWYTQEQWEKGKDGAFERQPSRFREWIEPGGRFEPASGRYHLYVSYACPWAHRTLIVRALLGLETSIGVSVVHPVMTSDGWHFAPDDPEYPTEDALHGLDFLRHLYLKANKKYTGRVTVPVLWDKVEQTIVNNESSEIIRMLATHFQPLATRQRDLYPAASQDAIDKAMAAFYSPINNGVYRCGFAGTQSAYDAASDELFEALASWEAHLSGRQYLVGDTLSIADIALFVTLLRFDPVYYVHFKTSQKHIYEYPNLWRHVRRVFQTAGVASTCHMDHIKTHYFRSHPQLNPRGFVPSGPDPDLNAPLAD